MADELGSGVRNLYNYGRKYSGKDPELVEGDIFRIIVPLDDSYSFDVERDKNWEINIMKESRLRKRTEKLTKNQQVILDNIEKNSHITIGALTPIVGITASKIKENLSKLKERGLIERVGAAKAAIGR